MGVPETKTPTDIPPTKLCNPIEKKSKALEENINSLKLKPPNIVHFM